MAFCESWLNPLIPNRDILISGYCSPLRNDRSSRRGGGVCLYIKETISFRTVTDLPQCPPWVECIWAHLPIHRIIFVVLYVPPSLTSEQNKSVLDYVESCSDSVLARYSDSNLIIVGDLNHLPTDVLECSLSLRQVVDFPTRKAVTLDKILLDSEICDQYHTPFSSPNFGKSDHATIILKPLLSPLTRPKVVKVFDFRKSNVDRFVNFLASHDWSSFYRSPASVDDKCDLFYSIIDEALEMFPYTFVEMSANEKPWITPKLKLLINLRYEAYRSKNFNQYHHYRHKIKNEIVNAKSSWIKSMKTKRNDIWGALKPSKSILVVNGEDNEPIPSIDTADALNQFFAESFTKANSSLFREIRKQDENPWNVNVTVSSTCMLLRNMKVGKSAGLDQLSSRLIKASADALAPPVTHIFALSIESATMPKCWKVARVVPIPKLSAPTIRDFRPISLLPLLSKILEKIVLASVKHSLIENYGSNQFGFRPRSSTLFAHITIHDFVTRQLEYQNISGVALITLDIQKAFDSLSHFHLLNSLSKSGLPKAFIVWIQSFLNDRKQTVSFNGRMSKFMVDVTSGVPQGSVLAPYLFASHMGSLSALMPTTKMVKYADDVTLLCPFQKNDNVESLIHCETENVKVWCQNNGLQLNNKKTKVLIFNKPNIRPVLLSDSSTLSQVKILGIIFQSNLSWTCQINYMTTAACRRIHILRVLKRIPSITKEDLIMIYNATIVSLLEFNSPLMVGMTSENAQRIERIGKRCHRIICGPHCKCASFPQLNDRRTKQALQTFSRMHDPTHILNHLIPHKLPRSNHYFLDSFKTERRMKSFIPWCALMNNSQK